MMASIQTLFTEYASSHTNRINVVIHWICVPLIYFSIICFLIVLRMETGFPFVLTVVPLVMIYYFLKSKSILVGMMAFTLFCIVVAGMLLKIPDLPLGWVALCIFVVAWIGQFIGHKIEGKKPSFLRDLEFLLVGPAWLLSKVYRKAGIGV